jgi:hypothetical protein
MRTTTEPRIVTPQEAQWALDGETAYATWRELAHTVATEPDRTRAAVVAALREVAELWYSDEGPGHPLSAVTWLTARADAIENGADF